MSKNTLRTTYVIKLFLRSSYWVCWHSQTFVQHPYEKRTNSTAIIRRKSNNIIKSVSRVFLSRSHVNPTTMGFLGDRRHERDTKTCPFDCLEKLVKMFLKYLVRRSYGSLWPIQCFNSLVPIIKAIGVILTFLIGPMVYNVGMVNIWYTLLC